MAIPEEFLQSMSFKSDSELRADLVFAKVAAHKAVDLGDMDSILTLMLVARAAEVEQGRREWARLTPPEYKWMELARP